MSGETGTRPRPEEISFEDFKDVYMQANETRCKGCTNYRLNQVTGSILVASEEKEEQKEEGKPCEIRFYEDRG